MNINLRTIFCHLTGDENFLSTVIETNNFTMKRENTRVGFNLMDTVVYEYNTLTPYDKQSYESFPNNVKSILTPDYVRIGINNVIEKDSGIVNISFLNSLNLLLRPELLNYNIQDQNKALILLESFVSHMIQRNYQIDKNRKLKNTKRVQNINAQLVQRLKEGKITHDVIQAIINIFEINLIVFDISKLETQLYWTKGTVYDVINVFKPIYSMIFVKGNYEPLMPPQNKLSQQIKHKIYTNILLDNNIKTESKIKLSYFSHEYISTWEISTNEYVRLVDIYFKSPLISEING